ncbi:hypothetical protein EYF80_032058 [Liparis tanakae]|uniref:Uncharacterized protein n=1 Tax=Liparis tanakae TaxID=230148 RepID=A0A4Z2GW52_9TELE|nr:hypothetical protein EYF80_032058 [Liparis tanakae]
MGMPMDTLCIWDRHPSGGRRRMSQHAPRPRLTVPPRSAPPPGPPRSATECVGSSATVEPPSPPGAEESVTGGLGIVHMYTRMYTNTSCRLSFTRGTKDAFAFARIGHHQGTSILPATDSDEDKLTANQRIRFPEINDQRQENQLFPSSRSDLLRTLTPASATHGPRGGETHSGSVEGARDRKGSQWERRRAPGQELNPRAAALVLRGTQPEASLQRLNPLICAVVRCGRARRGQRGDGRMQHRSCNSEAVAEGLMEGDRPDWARADGPLANGPRRGGK